jgi:protein-S-isoprenylcysteine O-methyltransferase Ste14
MTEFIIAYFLLIVFFLLEIFIRKGATAKSIETTSHDKRSTYLIGLTLVVILFLSIIFKLFRIGEFSTQKVAILGLMVMVIGLVIRIYSMITLSRYYTRTLTFTNEHELVQKGLYRVIRHPGYLGTLLIWNACGLAMQNKIVFVISIILTSIAYYYRIDHEEKMLIGKFGEKYRAYQKHSWRLLPFIW